MCNYFHLWTKFRSKVLLYNIKMVLRGPDVARGSYVAPSGPRDFSLKLCFRQTFLLFYDTCLMPFWWCSPIRVSWSEFLPIHRRFVLKNQSRMRIKFLQSFFKATISGTKKIVPGYYKVHRNLFKNDVKLLQSDHMTSYLTLWCHFSSRMVSSFSFR